MPIQHAANQHQRVRVDRLGNQHDLAQLGFAVALDDFAQHVLAHPNRLGDLELFAVGIPDRCSDDGADRLAPALQYFALRSFPRFLLCLHPSPPTSMRSVFYLEITVKLRFS